MSAIRALRKLRITSPFDVRCRSRSSDKQHLVARASKIGLTPIIEDLAELVLDSSSKKSKDDTFLKDREKSYLVDPKSV